jgi:CBS domain-containing protein
VDPRLRRLGALALAPALIAGGLVLIVLGDALSGLALLTLGWFVNVAMRVRRRRDRLERLIDDITVGEVMETLAFVVAPQATLDTFALALEEGEEATVARVMRGDELLGLVGLREIGRVSRRRWGEVHASEAMVATDDLPVLDPGDALGPAATLLGASSAPGLPVILEGRLAGILTRLAVGRTVHERAVEQAARGAGR